MKQTTLPLLCRPALEKDCRYCSKQFSQQCWFASEEARYNRHLQRKGFLAILMEQALKRNEGKYEFDLGRFKQLKRKHGDRYLLKIYKNLLSLLSEWKFNPKRMYINRGVWLHPWYLEVD